MSTTTEETPVEETVAPEEAPAEVADVEKTPVARRPLLLEKGVKITLAGADAVRSKKGAQRHILAKGETVALCGIDTTAWIEKVVENDQLVNCPLCAEAQKAQIKAEKDAEKASKKGGDAA